MNLYQYLSLTFSFPVAPPPRFSPPKKNNNKKQKEKEKKKIYSFLHATLRIF